MPSIHTTLINASGGQVSSYGFNTVTQRPVEYSTAELRNRHNQLDTWEVHHDLNARDLRILFKILAKHYEDCGRKRGAILRYIKHFREMEDKVNSERLPLGRLHSQLKRKASL